MTYVAFSGNIATGKSSAAIALAELMGSYLVAERVADHPYLEQFYADPGAWAFRLQMFNIADRAKAIRAGATAGDFVVDRSYEEDFIFVDLALEAGFIDERERAIYDDMFGLVAEALPAPTLMVHLRSSEAGTLQSRLRDRSRSMESGVSIQYLEALQERYDGWIAGYAGSKLILNSGTLSSRDIAAAVVDHLATH